MYVLRTMTGPMAGGGPCRPCLDMDMVEAAIVSTMLYKCTVLEFSTTVYCTKDTSGTHCEGNGHFVSHGCACLQEMP